MNRKGVVLRDQGNVVIVDLDGVETPCIVRKSLRHAVKRKGKAVVVGDLVEVEQSGDAYAVCAVGERRSLLSRPDPSMKRREQILVANIDEVLVVASAKRPDLEPRLIDRFLVAVESRELEATIVVNKMDLDEEGESRPMIEFYRGLGYAVFETSAETGEGIDALRAELKDHTTTLLGHSGVGKSSVANALDPSLSLRTGEVQEGTGKGTHTTTTVSLLRLPWGGYLVDTPGIREFGLWNLEPADVRFYFREIAALLPECRFSDCLHEHEPACAVKAAVEKGAVSHARYESYRRILESMRADTPEY